MPNTTSEVIESQANVTNDSIDQWDLHMPRSKQLKIDSSEDFARNKKLKHFCPKWLTEDIFKDWLVPHDDTFKARCIACNKVLNAGKSELVKHAAGRKHAQNMESMSRTDVSEGEGANQQQPQSTLELLSMELGITDEEPDETVIFSADSETQTNLTGSDSIQQMQGEKQLELLARIANAMERIADSLAAKTPSSTTVDPT